MSEQVLFNEGGVLVTNNRIVSGDKTGSVRSITSVNTSKDSLGDVAGGCAIILVGIVFCLLAGVIAGVLANILFGAQARDAAFYIVILLSLGIVVYGIQEIATSHRYSYSIHLNMANGQEIVLTSKNVEYHRRVLRAINDAIAAHS